MRNIACLQHGYPLNTLEKEPRDLCTGHTNVAIHTQTKSLHLSRDGSTRTGKVFVFVRQVFSQSTVRGQESLQPTCRDLFSCKPPIPRTFDMFLLTVTPRKNASFCFCMGIRHVELFFTEPLFCLVRYAVNLLQAYLNVGRGFALRNQRVKCWHIICPANATRQNWAAAQLHFSTGRQETSHIKKRISSASLYNFIHQSFLIAFQAQRHCLHVDGLVTVRAGYQCFSKQPLCS